MKILIDNGHGSDTPGKRSPDGKFLEYRSPGQIVRLFVPHLGHGIGILKTVALSSISGASNFVPQHGQRNQVLPLSIITEIIIVPLAVPRKQVDVAGEKHQAINLFAVKIIPDLQLKRAGDFIVHIIRTELCSECLHFETIGLATIVRQSGLIE